MKIFVGDLEVLESGFVESDGMKPIKIHLADNFIVVFEVEAPESDSDETMKFDVVDGVLKVKILTKISSLNIGPKTFIKIGVLHKRDIFMRVRCNVMGEFASYTLGYTFALGLEKTND